MKTLKNYIEKIKREPNDYAYLYKTTKDFGKELAKYAKHFKVSKNLVIQYALEETMAQNPVRSRRGKSGKSITG